MSTDGGSQKFDHATLTARNSLITQRTERFHELLTPTDQLVYDMLIRYEEFVDKQIVRPVGCSPVGPEEWVPHDGSLLYAFMEEQFALPCDGYLKQPMFRLCGHRTLQTLRRVMSLLLGGIVEGTKKLDVVNTDKNPLQPVWQNLRYLHDTDWLYSLTPICPYVIQSATMQSSRKDRHIGVTWGDVALFINCDHYIQRFIYVYRWLIFMKQICNINPLIPMKRNSSGTHDDHELRLCRNYLHAFGSLRVHIQVMEEYGQTICAAYQHPQSTTQESLLGVLKSLFEEFCSVYNTDVQAVSQLVDWFSVKSIKNKEKNCGY